MLRPTIHWKSLLLNRRNLVAAFEIQPPVVPSYSKNLNIQVKEASTSPKIHGLPIGKGQENLRLPDLLWAGTGYRRTGAIPILPSKILRSSFKGFFNLHLHLMFTSTTSLPQSFLRKAQYRGESHSFVPRYKRHRPVQRNRRLDRGQVSRDPNDRAFSCRIA